MNSLRYNMIQDKLNDLERSRNILVEALKFERTKASKNFKNFGSIHIYEEQINVLVELELHLKRIQRTNNNTVTKAFT